MAGEKGHYNREVLNKNIKLTQITLDKYKEMRSIEPGVPRSYFFRIDYHKQFFFQAKMMVDYKSSFCDNLIYSSQKPSYSDMNNFQISWYFHWRNKCRNKEFIKTSESYIFVYIYEILNNIGITNPNDGIEKLLLIWNNFVVHNEEQYKKLVYFLPIYMQDYIVMNNLKKEYLEILPKSTTEDFKTSVINFLEILDTNNYENCVETITKFSNYNIISGKYYKSRYGYTINESLSYIFKALLKLYVKIDTIVLKLFDKPVWQDWEPYDRALYFKRESNYSGFIVISQFEAFICKNGAWKMKFFDPGKVNKKVFTKILKSVDHYLRETLGYSNKLVLNEPQSRLLNLVKEEVERYCDDNDKVGIYNSVKSRKLKKLVQIVVEIDRNKFNEIRQKAEEIQEKLIVDDEVEVLNIATSLVEADDSNDSILTQTEMQAIQIILSGHAVCAKLENLTRDQSMLLEVLIETINEKFLERIGDNIIQMDSIPYIYDDYIEEVQTLINSHE